MEVDHPMRRTHIHMYMYMYMLTCRKYIILGSQGYLGHRVSRFVSTFIALCQVVDRKLPQEFNYHGVPAPWIQMRLLRILALLGADDLK